MLRRTLLVVAAVTAFAVMAMPAIAAKGGSTTTGNSPSAKACQKGGWETQARTEDPTTAFTSQEECTSYAAKGGTLTDLQPTSSAAQEACENQGGVFADYRPTSFTCTGNLGVLSMRSDPVFLQACDDIAGTIRYVINGGIFSTPVIVVRCQRDPVLEACTAVGGTLTRDMVSYDDGQTFRYFTCTKPGLTGAEYQSFVGTPAVRDACLGSSVPGYGGGSFSTVYTIPDDFSSLTGAACVGGYEEIDEEL